MSRRRARLPGPLPALAALLLALQASVGHAASLAFCDHAATVTADQKDKLFRFGGIIKAELDKSGQSVALVARSGTDLRRFGQRYSHAGVSLKASPNAPWSVRQLYYACDERKPKIFDQGISGFLLGTDDPAVGYVSVILLPPTAAVELERSALDNALALQLLGTTYSANAYPFSQRYQNCNQWVMELLAKAWGTLDGSDNERAQAQRWLWDSGYMPSRIEVGNPALVWASAVVPWLHSDDHPSDDVDRLRYEVSMPASIESFVQRVVPGATRVEFCHTEHEAVIRRGWEPIADGCVAGPSDEVITLD